MSISHFKKYLLFLGLLGSFYSQAQQKDSTTGLGIKAMVGISYTNYGFIDYYQSHILRDVTYIPGGYYSVFGINRIRKSFIQYGMGYNNVKRKDLSYRGFDFSAEYYRLKNVWKDKLYFRYGVLLHSINYNYAKPDYSIIVNAMFISPKIGVTWKVNDKLLLGVNLYEHSGYEIRKYSWETNSVIWIWQLSFRNFEVNINYQIK